MSAIAAYVAWGYGLSALVLGALVLVSWRAHRRALGEARARRLRLEG